MIRKTHQLLLLTMLAGTVLSAAPVNAMFAGGETDGPHALASTSAARPHLSRRVAAVQQKLETLQATEPNAGLMVRTLIQSMEPYANRIHDPAYQTEGALDALWRSQKNKTITFDVARQKALQFFNEINSVTLTKSFVQKLEGLNQGLPAHKQIDTSFVNVTRTSSVAGEAAPSSDVWSDIRALARRLERERPEETSAECLRQAVLILNPSRPVRNPTPHWQLNILKDPDNPASLPHLLRHIDVDPRTAEEHQRAEYLTGKALEAVHGVQPTDAYDRRLSVFKEGFAREDALRSWGDFKEGEIMRVKAGIVDVMAEASEQQRQKFTEAYQKFLQEVHNADMIPLVMEGIDSAQHMNIHQALLDTMWHVCGKISLSARAAMDARRYPPSYDFAKARADLLSVFNGLTIREKVDFGYWYNQKIQEYAVQSTPVDTADA